MNILILVLVLFGSICIRPAFLQAAGGADLNKLMEETQQRSSEPQEATFVWWIPQEYWKISLAQNPQVSAQQKEEFTEVFKPYLLFVVVDGKVSTMGMINYKSEEEVRGLIKLEDKDGNIYQPLKENEINQDTKSFLMMMKPMWVNALGAMGQNMHFFLFTNKNKEGGRFCEASEEGRFSVLLGDRRFDWKLPLSSLIAPKICPICGAKLNGSYKFCPWDGTKLEE
ncbi:MAG: zinc ribbon domain-containing protein [Candidatus Omnitrophica bacterium]|nr:zinc ribbon domain-containing protein [Candidatus Omnitrophota bacterium]